MQYVQVRTVTLLLPAVFHALSLGGFFSNDGFEFIEKHSYTYTNSRDLEKY